MRTAPAAEAIPANRPYLLAHCLDVDGLLSYAERLEPGWIGQGRSFELLAPGGLLGMGERWCKTFLSVAHGEATLRGIDYSEWTMWRDVALERATEFRRVFDPLDTISSFALGAGLTVESLARALQDDPTFDPVSATAQALETLSRE
jgi:hypothetical protein